MMTNHI